MHDGELHAFDHPERKRTFHRNRLAVEIGRHVAGIGQGYLAIASNAQGETRRLSVAATDQTTVQGLQKKERIGICFCGRSNCADEQRNQHPRLEPFAE